MPSGLCECGCGRETSTARGEPRRFVRGHNSRLPENRGLTAADAKLRSKRERYATDPEYRAAAKARAKARYWANREESIASAAAWAKAHPERRAETSAAWVKRNPDTIRRHAQERKARKRQAFVEFVDPLVVLERADGVCGICGDDVDPFKFDVDHIVPLCHGGFHNYENTQPAHVSCNRSKGGRYGDV